MEENIRLDTNPSKHIALFTPGSNCRGNDALPRLQYFKDFHYTMDVAVKITDAPNELIAGVPFKFNKWNYDDQFVGGVYQRNIAIGTGWAGNTNNSGFKTEISIFRNYRHLSDDSGIFITSVSADYISHCQYSNSTP